MSETQELSPDRGERRWKAVYTIVEGQNKEKKYWLRIGVAFQNRDQSLNVRLDAMPVNGTLHIRDADRVEDRAGRSDGGERGGYAGKAVV